MAFHRTTERVRRFPRTVRPYPAETLACYLRRLAAANCCHHQEVIDWLRIPPGTNNNPPARPIIDIERLASATGRPRSALAKAIPDLANPRRDPRARSDRPPPGYLPSRNACRRCVARRLGTTELIDHWVTLTSRICLTHRRWLGANSADIQQPLLDNAPDILQARKQHVSLVHRYGPDTVTAVYWQASHVVERWCQRGAYAAHRNHRLAQLGEQGRPYVFTSAALEAACYPDIIAITSVMTPPNHSASGLQIEPDSANSVAAEIGRRIGYPDLNPTGAYDPLARWLIRLHDRLHIAS